MPPSSDTDKRPDCIKCRYFRITWEPDHPRACEAMGFKTKLMPSAEVKRASGQECLHFAPKPERKDSARSQGNVSTETGAGRSWKA
ncbi:hypothetical protein [Magnetofaba australis]|uniref:Uracil-DNA glycosylase n=1 Tax=Magnetofaba australis IT-1 TaxID=1434232 RepID=A0A1Y2K5J7_9PROT|nr:hypothetical protein [Magnetofaba australis]OSM04954.1 hypothetical protein MAIT1_03071 [Magnetofaba australis IT-1]